MKTKRNNFSRFRWTLLITTLSMSLTAQNATFITTWYTGHEGASGPTSILLPVDASYEYLYDVDWDNDGIFDDLQVTTSIQHDYGEVDTVTIAIRGEFPRLHFDMSGDQSKLIGVDYWHAHQWLDIREMFAGTTHLNYLPTQFAHLREIEDISGMFAYSGYTGKQIGNWDVCNVKDFSRLFYMAKQFDTRIASWDLSNAKDVSYMFAGACSFNQDLRSWTFSNVDDMTGMFEGATDFHQYVVNWDMSNVKSMKDLFKGATSFDVPLAKWRLNPMVDMRGMLDSSGMSIENFDKTLNGWQRQEISGRHLGAKGIYYCHQEHSYEQLVTDRGWQIDGAVKNCDLAKSLSDFVMTVEATSFTIPTWHEEDYNYHVDWDNDGVFDDLNINANITHTYPEEGIYTIRINGLLPHIYYSNDSGEEQILSIDQWGDNPWTSMRRAFEGAIQMDISALDAPDLSNVTDMSSMFSHSNVNADLTNWDVSNITNMRKLFHWTPFNGDVSTWDVSQVEDMELLFAQSSFDSDISNWDVSNVTKMKYMFFRNFYFTGDIGDWDVSNVTNMLGMFFEATAFNSDISEWDVSNVIHMSDMFGYASSFDIDIGDWDVSRVAFMNGMFNNAIAFNQYIGDWDVSAVSKMQEMFRGASSFNQDISRWDVSSVNNMNAMFADAHKFNADIGTWDTGAVRNMSFMFSNAINFNHPLAKWDIQEVETMREMLNLCNMTIANYDSTLVGWSRQPIINAVTLGAEGLHFCISTEQRDSLIEYYNWEINDDMFGCEELLENFKPFITTWDTSIEGETGVTQIRLPIQGLYYVDWDNDGIVDEVVLDEVVHDFGMPGIYTISVYGNLDHFRFDSSDDSHKLISIDQWGDVAWTSLFGAFTNASNVVVTATDTPDLSDVQNVESMFEGAKSLQGDFSEWDVSSVTKMNQMFKGAQVFNSDLSLWDVSNVQDFSYMFDNCINFDSDLSSWNVSSATNMMGMFNNCEMFNSDVSNWEVEQVKDMTSMFSDCTLFDCNLGDWNLSDITVGIYMLDRSGLSIANYDSTLIGWQNQGIKNIVLGADDLYYCDAENARWSLIQNGWHFLGDQKDCGVSVDNIDQSEIIIFPNPSRGQFEIKLDGISDEDIKITILDAKGAKIWWPEMTRNNYPPYEISHMAAGVYLLVVQRGADTYTEKIVVIR